jgi:hypothetical protein
MDVIWHGRDCSDRPPMSSPTTTLPTPARRLTAGLRSQPGLRTGVSCCTGQTSGGSGTTHSASYVPTASHAAWTLPKTSRTSHFFEDSLPSASPSICFMVTTPGTPPTPAHHIARMAYPRYCRRPLAAAMQLYLLYRPFDWYVSSGIS